MSLFALDASPLCVLLDIRQPQAYLALHPAEAMAGACGIEINWLPLAVPPLKAPSEPKRDDDRGIRHRRYRAEAIAREIETYAGVQGLVIEAYYREPDPSALNLAWLWVREQRPERLFGFLSEAFRAYWSLALDISSEADIGSLLDRCDLGGAGFASWCVEVGRAKAASLAEELGERGLSRAPSYLVGDEVFIGRQHLPMIRWILEGRSGRGPI